MNIDWTQVLTTISTSAIVAVVFSGGTNYYLQKKNRKGNLTSEKGYKLIDEIYRMNEERIKASFYVSFFEGHLDSELQKTLNDYLIEYNKFKIEVNKFSILSNKKTNIMLQDYLVYLEEISSALQKRINNDSYSFNHDNSKIDQLFQEIVKVIKKQIA